MAQWLNWGDGHDGSPNAISGAINAYATCTGTAGSATVTTTLTVTAGDQVLLHQTRHASAAGTWEIVKVASTGSGNFTATANLVNSYSTGAQAVLIPQYTGGDISGSVGCTAWNGTVGGIIALMSNGDLTISGTISANGAGMRGGSGTDPATQGEGRTGTGSQSISSNNGGGGGGNASAGAGGSYDGTGGNGGVNDQSANPTNPSLGTADYTKAFLGNGGGGGANQANGGNGSGIIIIISKNVTISGTVSANGSPGNTSPVNRPSGGGAGGFVIVKTQVATLGTNKITVGAGAAGVRADSWNGYPTAGTTGRIRCDYFTSISGSTSPTLSSAQDLTLNVFAGGGNFFAFF